MFSPKRIAIVGAGIVGLCAADELLGRGFQVTILEREAEPGDGCSYGNGGLIVPSHFEPLAAPGMIAKGLRMMADPESPFAIHGMANLEVLSWVARFMIAANRRHVERCSPVLRDLHLISREIYERSYSSEARKAGYEQKGELMICRTPAALAGERHLAARASELGLNTRILGKADLRTQEPNCDIDAEGAIYFDDDGKLNPKEFMKALRQRVLDRGAIILDGCEVLDFVVEGSKIRSVVVTDGGQASATTGDGRSGNGGAPPDNPYAGVLDEETVGGRHGGREPAATLEVEADAFVFAAGVWTAGLAKKLKLNLPMLGGKGYGFTVSHPPQTPRLPALLIEARLAVTPMNEGLRFVGTMELGRPGPLSIDESRVRGIRESIAQFYPAFRGFDLSRSEVWAGLRPCSPDGMPYMGRTQIYDNLVLATGHGMMGMSLGPISGRIVAEVLSNEAPSISLDLMAPDRYA